MNHIPTTATAVQKMRRAAKKRAAATRNSLTACLDVIAKEAGYDHWKHVTTCVSAPNLGGDVNEAIRKVLRENLSAVPAQDARAVEVNRAKLHSDLFNAARSSGTQRDLDWINSLTGGAPFEDKRPRDREAVRKWKIDKVFSALDIEQRAGEDLTMRPVMYRARERDPSKRQPGWINFSKAALDVAYQPHLETFALWAFPRGVTPVGFEGTDARPEQHPNDANQMLWSYDLGVLPEEVRAAKYEKRAGR